MSFVNNDVEERYRKHAAPLHSGSDRGRGGLIVAPKSMPISDEALGAIFRNARTLRRWQDKPVSAAVLMAVYDLMRWGPTSANCSPARIVFVVSKEGKERLTPHLLPDNVGKTMSAPAT